MGAWGTGIFSDDFASDLRADYRELITDGKSHSEAMELLSRKHGESLADPEEAPVFWIALAATSWDLGRLDEQLKAKALAVISAGGGLERWDKPKDRRARQAALNKLADKLGQPQKPPIKLKRKPRFVTDWKVHEVVGFRQRSGKWLLLHVVGIHSGEAGDHPIVNMLDWAGESTPPDQAEVENSQVVWLAETKDGSVGKRKSICFLVDNKLTKSGRIARWNITLKRRRSLLDWAKVHLEKKSQERLSYAGPEFFENDFLSPERK
jgi:hypothetical protein